MGNLSFSVELPSCCLVGVGDEHIVDGGVCTVDSVEDVVTGLTSAVGEYVRPSSLGPTGIPL